MQMLVDEQWALLAPLLKKSSVKTTNRGRPRLPDREVLDGVLWVLKTGAQWNELPDKYPPYQTCHRRFQEWVRAGVLAELLRALAQDMEARGGISLEECFIDGTFSLALKKGPWCWKDETRQRHQAHGYLRPRVSSGLRRCGKCFSA